MVALNKNREIKIIADPNDLFNAVAEDFTQRAIDSVNNHGVFNVVLAGGNTPKLFFDALAANDFCRTKTPWQQIKFYFGDERYVPTTDVASNYHMAYEHLFSKVSVLVENIFPIPTKFKEPKDAAKQYESIIKNVKFDLIYLGLGDDAHTASLMPFSEVVTSSTNQLVAALWVPQLKMYRITLTSTAINNAACVIFLVEGANKAPAVYSVLAGPTEPQKYPAQLIQPSQGKTIWYLDQAAAGKLKIV